MVRRPEVEQPKIPDPQVDNRSFIQKILAFRDSVTGTRRDLVDISMAGIATITLAVTSLMAIDFAQSIYAYLAHQPLAIMPQSPLITVVELGVTAATIEFSRRAFN